jgi:hypothetical protein
MAEVATALGPPVQLLTLPVLSKREALKAGNEAATGYARLCELPSLLADDRARPADRQ